jgi:hypothetical protein
MILSLSTLKKLLNFLIIVLLLTCICILPVFIIISYYANINIVSQVGNINNLIIRLDKNHKINAELSLYELEIKRAEYNCYFQHENQAFESSLTKLLDDYKNYIANNNSLTAEQRSDAYKAINLVQETMISRRELIHNLNLYEHKRIEYLNSLNEKNIQIKADSEHSKNCFKNIH